MNWMTWTILLNRRKSLWELMFYQFFLWRLEVLCNSSKKYILTWSAILLASKHISPPTRVIQKVLLCTKYYIISNAYPYLAYSSLFRKVSWTKAQFNQSRDLLSKRSRVVYLDACLRHWRVSLPQPFLYHWTDKTMYILVREIATSYYNVQLKTEYDI